MNNTKSSKLIRYVLYGLHLFLGINATIGGLLLMLKPDGSLLQMNESWLEQSPFSSYFLPGFMLFTFIGLLSLISWCGLVFRFNWTIANKLNLYADKHWAWAYSIYTGIITILWITFQLVFTQYFWLQPVVIIIAVSILICSLTPAVMEHYKNNKI